MFRKSVYLFSVAILGLSLVPSNAWADETTEAATMPTVTTELIESPVSVAEDPVEVAEPNAEAQVEEPAAVPEQTEVAEAVTSESPEVAEAAAMLPTAAAAENTANAETAVRTEAAATTQQKAARASVPILKEDNDGKIVDHEKAITDEKAKIPAEYNFMPNFDQLDGIVINSSAGYKESASSFSFDLKKESAGSITVIYKNVGTYNGKVIDMKVTVKDWTVLSGSVYSPQLSIHKTNGITMNGIGDVRLNYTFLDNLSSHAVNVSGFFNFTDIDLQQSIDLFNSNNVQNYYVTKNNELYFKTRNGYIRIGEINRKRTNNSDMDHWLTYTYKNVSNFDVRYNQDYESGAVFNYTYQAPIVIEETPVNPDPKDPDIIEETPAKEVPQEEIKAPEPDAKTEPTVVNVAAKAEKVETVEVAKAEVKEAEPLKQSVLPQTNDRSSSIFTILGATCLFLLSALFLNKKKV
ncbi:hypothetical protein IGI39_003824 [Enterococcus sp. AZ135]|uniref:LPXTG cell wall anchor domain-containing protein n=1 Tax=unclassified Enterococcus TaxID=2608891 RepID=UPI003F27D616